MHNDPASSLTLGQMAPATLLALLSGKDLMTVPHFGAAGLVWRQVMCSESGACIPCFHNNT